MSRVLEAIKSFFYVFIAFSIIVTAFRNAARGQPLLLYLLGGGFVVYVFIQLLSGYQSGLKGESAD